MVYITSLHRAAGGILPGHGNYVNRHILSPDFSHALRVRLSVKKFSPRQYIYTYIHLLYTYTYIITHYIIHIHTHNHANAHALFFSSGFLPLSCFCVAFHSSALFVRSACLLLVAGILSNPFALCLSSQPFRATQSHNIFRRVFSFCFLLRLAVSLA